MTGDTKHYRLDLEKPRQLTPEEERRLDEAPLDYSDIPPLGDEFFLRAKPTISAEEMQRRREALRQADANNRIEGIFPDPATDEIFEAYIRGEIDSAEMMARVKAWVAREISERDGRNRPLT